MPFATAGRNRLWIWRCIAKNVPVRVRTLDISDRGPGVPESELEHIFRPFYRLDAARERDTGGFGVGLAIADRAVRLHHGEVRANNRPDGGLVVSLRLPCEK